MLAAGCSEQTPQMRLDRVTPAAVDTAASTVMNIHGANFAVGIVIDFDEPSLTVSPYVASISRASNSVFLGTVERLDDALLSAVVPAGLELGQWDLSVTSPDGATLILENAFEVVGRVTPPECSADGDCADTDPCTVNEHCAQGVCTSDVVAASTLFADRDGDGSGDAALSTEACGPLVGHVSTPGDCDDDPAACGASCTPGSTAPDICDGFDNDCDGETDEDPEATVWFVDLDGDGAGSPLTPFQGCDPPSGYVLNDADCDDDPDACGAGCSGLNTNPDICDGLDNDCDSETDEDAAALFYRDLDADGAGDPGATLSACVAPEGYVAVGGDCDDDPAVCGASCSPSITAPDGCDGHDNDCDGSTDEDGGTDWFNDVDGDSYGGEEVFNGCAAPAGFVSAGGDCDDDPLQCGASCNPGINADVCDGFDNDCQPATADGAGDPAVGVACDGVDADACLDGAMTCNVGVMSCDDDAVSQVEGSSVPGSCTDEVDNDCDGAFDAADADCDTLGPLTNAWSTLHEGNSAYSTHAEAEALVFDGDTPFSLCIWFKTSAIDGSPKTLMGKMSNSGARPGYRIVYDGGGPMFALQLHNHHSNNLIEVSVDVSSGGYSDGQWHFIAATYDGSGDATGGAVYLDGAAQVLNQNKNSLTGSLLTSVPFSLGSRDGGQVWPGNLDESTVWNKALSAAEVAALYNGGVPVDPTTLSFGVAAVAWWRHGDGDVYPTLTDNIGTSDGDLTAMETDPFVADSP